MRAEINNPANSRDVIVNRHETLSPRPRSLPCPTSDMHALTAGTGNVIVTGGAGATMSNTGLFGIDAEAYGGSQHGSINTSERELSAAQSKSTAPEYLRPIRPSPSRPRRAAQLP